MKTAGNIVVSAVLYSVVYFGLCHIYDNYEIRKKKK